MISLRPDEERANIDLQLEAVPAFRITGQIMGAVSLTGLAINLVRAGGRTTPDESTIAGAGANPQGRFTLAGVPAGTYALRVFVPPNMPIMSHGTAPLKELPREPTLWADLPITVIDRDVEVAVPVREGVRISGRVEFDGAVPPPALDILSFRAVVLNRADGGDADLRGLYLRDGRFTTIQVPPGRYLIRAMAPDGWTLKSVIAAGRDVADTPLDVGSTDIANVVITFADHAPRLMGQVRFDAGGPPRRAWVTIFSTDRALWTDFGLYPRTFLMIHTGLSGFYSGELPAGSYYVVATQDSLGELRTPEVFEALAALATSVVIGDRDTKTQDVQVQRVRR